MNKQKSILQQKVDKIEARLTELGIANAVFGVRVKPRPIIWSFAKFQLVLKPHRGFVLDEDTLSTYTGWGVTVEAYDNRAEYPLPVRYYHSVEDFSERFSLDEIPNLGR